MLTMSVSSTLTSAVISDISAMVMMVLPAEFWMPGTTDSPSAHREVGDHAIDGRVGIVLAQDIVEAHQNGLRLRDALLRGGQLRGVLLALHLGLDDAGFGFANGGLLRFVGELLEFEILLGEKLLVVQLLAAVEIAPSCAPGRPGPSPTRPAWWRCYRRRLSGRPRRRRNSASAEAQGGLLGVDVGFRLSVFDAWPATGPCCTRSPSLTRSSVRSPEALAPMLMIILGLDFARSSHHAGEVLARPLARSAR